MHHHLMNPEMLAIRLYGRLCERVPALKGTQWDDLDQDTRHAVLFTLKAEVTDPLNLALNEWREHEAALTTDARARVASQMLSALIVGFRTAATKLDSKRRDALVTEAFALADVFLAKQLIPFQLKQPTEEGDGSAWIKITQTMAPEDAAEFAEFVKPRLHIDDVARAKFGQLVVLKQTWERSKAKRAEQESEADHERDA